MIFATTVLSRTPPYVWLLLAWLVWQGVAALRPRSQPFWRVLSVPVAFVAAGLVPLAWRVGGAGLLAAWAGAAAALAPVGLRTGPRLLAVDRLAGRVVRAGSPWPLVRNVSVFAVQYALVVAASVHAADPAILRLVGRAVSGATAGYFGGWAISAWGQYSAARNPVGWVKPTATTPPVSFPEA